MVAGKAGWSIPLRNLYSETNFYVKHNLKLSPIIQNNMGVNQGGVASGFLFRIYMSDLKTYLDYRVGVCIDNDVVAHRLWVDDLIMFLDTASGLQKQLNALYKFCANNRMIVSEAKFKGFRIQKRLFNKLTWVYNITAQCQYINCVYRCWYSS